MFWIIFFTVVIIFGAFVVALNSRQSAGGAFFLALSIGLLGLLLGVMLEEGSDMPDLKGLCRSSAPLELSWQVSEKDFKTVKDELGHSNCNIRVVWQPKPPAFPEQPGAEGP